MCELLLCGVCDPCMEGGGPDGGCDLCDECDGCDLPDLCDLCDECDLCDLSRFDPRSDTGCDVNVVPCRLPSGTKGSGIERRDELAAWEEGWP